MSYHIPSLTLPNYVFAKPAVAILVPITLGNIVGLATQPNRAAALYRSIRQPPLHPPAWLFGPVWTLLYGAMGYASYRAYTAGTQSAVPSVRSAFWSGATLYSAQLAVNLVWMPLFFVAESPVAATVDVVALMGLVGGVMGSWWNVDRVASWLMVPYLGWLGFATYLTVGAGVLNDWDFSKVPRNKDASVEGSDKKSN